MSARYSAKRVVLRAGRDAHLPIVRGEREHAAAIGGVDFGVMDIDSAEIRVVATGERLTLSIFRCADGIGDERVVPLSADHVVRMFVNLVTVARVLHDAGHALAIKQQLVHRERLTDLGARSRRRFHEDRIEQVTPRAVCRAVQRARHEHRIAVKDIDRMDLGAVGGDQLIEQAPAFEAFDAILLDEVRRHLVARERGAVDE